MPTPITILAVRDGSVSLRIESDDHLLHVPLTETEASELAEIFGRAATDVGRGAIAKREIVAAAAPSIEWKAGARR